MNRLVALCLLAGTAYGQSPPRAVVLSPVVNLYSRPAPDSDVVSQTSYGVTVSLLQEGEVGWVKVRTPDEYTGWGQLGSFRKLVQGEAEYATTGHVVSVESLMAHVYREPNVKKHQPLMTLPFETRLEALAEHSQREGTRWIAVRLVDGREAWIQSGDVTAESRFRTIPEILNLARRFLGLPYTWGGTTSFGYDCSGYTQMLCRRAGVNIPRDAGEQAAWSGMTRIDRGNLEPGDLLYFGRSEDRIDHTGMYLGGGEFIHATVNTHPVIQISKLDEAPWTKRYVGARRWRKST